MERIRREGNLACRLIAVAEVYCSYKVSPVYHTCKGHAVAMGLPSGLRPRADAPKPTSSMVLDMLAISLGVPESRLQTYISCTLLKTSCLAVCGRRARFDGGFHNLR
jgi:hypothetical protein